MNSTTITCSYWAKKCLSTSLDSPTGAWPHRWRHFCHAHLQLCGLKLHDYSNFCLLLQPNMPILGWVKDDECLLQQNWLNDWWVNRQEETPTQCVERRRLYALGVIKIIEPPKDFRVWQAIHARWHTSVSWLSLHCSHVWRADGV